MRRERDEKSLQSLVIDDGKASGINGEISNLYCHHKFLVSEEIMFF